jgi:hypothetical protein
MDPEAPLYFPPIAVPGSPENNAWVQLAYQQISQWMDSADQTLDNIVQMAKGGNQNKSNEYSRAATAQAQASGKDPCDILDEWYREARAVGETVEAQKIVQAQKALGCRNKRKRCP